MANQRPKLTGAATPGYSGFHVLAGGPGSLAVVVSGQ